MNIQRYETVGYASDTVKHDTGKYVKWEDVEKLLALRTAEAAELDLLREFCDRVTEYRLSYLDAKGEKSADMEKRLIGGRGPARNTTDAARRAAGAEQ